MTESKLEVAIASLEKQVAVFGAQLEYIQVQVVTTLELVRETNGAVRIHDVELAGLKERGKAIALREDDRHAQFKKLENRFWGVVVGSTLIGAIAGNVINLFVR